jgi:hypothetical protein
MLAALMGLVAEATVSDAEAPVGLAAEATVGLIETSMDEATISPAPTDPNERLVGLKMGGGGGYTPARVAERVW